MCLNNLPGYLRRHPGSISTRIIVNEGFRSSLTFPIAPEETVVAFLFLSSIEVEAFSNEDVALVDQLLEQISDALCPNCNYAIT